MATGWRKARIRTFTSEKREGNSSPVDSNLETSFNRGRLALALWVKRRRQGEPPFTHSLLTTPSREPIELRVGSQSDARDAV